jgi:hypothetical protein
MAISPNTNNYTLGAGVLFFNMKDLTSGLYAGERDLGNAPSFSFNTSIEKLPHFSSRGGLKVKDKEIISQLTPSVSFTLDEINKANFSMLVLGDLVEVSQTAATVTDEVHIAHIDRRIELGNRMVGYMKSTISSATGAFTSGETVTGGTSSATAEVIAGTTDEFTMRSISGTFQVGETLTGGTSTETATLDTVPVFDGGHAVVTDATGATTYTAGVDYSFNLTLKDDKIGRIFIPSGSAITEGESIKVTYDYQDYTYTELHAYKETQMEGTLRFVSDNPAGTQYELQVWRCSIAPAGDTSMIGEDWSTLEFTGEVLKDEVGHPDSPYMTIKMDM